MGLLLSPTLVPLPRSVNYFVAVNYSLAAGVLHMRGATLTPLNVRPQAWSNAPDQGYSSTRSSQLATLRPLFHCQDT
jgi:hypothetical protein